MKGILEVITTLQQSENIVIDTYVILLLIAAGGVIVSKYLNNEMISKKKKLKVRNNFLRYSKNLVGKSVIPLGVMLIVLAKGNASMLIILGVAELAFACVTIYILVVSVEIFGEMDDPIFVEDFPYLMIKSGKGVCSDNCYFKGNASKLIIPKEDREIIVVTNNYINEVELKLESGRKKFLFKSREINNREKKIFRIPTNELFEYCNKNSISPKFKIKLKEK